jgi:hypothetical protein
MPRYATYLFNNVTIGERREAVVNGTSYLIAESSDAQKGIYEVTGYDNTNKEVLRVTLPGNVGFNPSSYKFVEFARLAITCKSAATTTVDYQLYAGYGETTSLSGGSGAASAIDTSVENGSVVSAHYSPVLADTNGAANMAAAFIKYRAVDGPRLIKSLKLMSPFGDNFGQVEAVVGAVFIDGDDLDDTVAYYNHKAGVDAFNDVASSQNGFPTSFPDPADINEFKQSIVGSDLKHGVDVIDLPLYIPQNGSLLAYVQFNNAFEGLGTNFDFNLTAEAV